MPAPAGCASELEAQRLTETGIALAAEGDHAAALDCFAAVVAARPHDPVALRNAARSLDACGRPAEALQAFRKSAFLDPVNARTFLEIAALCERLGELRQAERSYKRAVIIEPDANACMRLAELREAKSDLAAAVRYRRAAVSAAPEDIGAHVALGLTLLKAGLMTEGWQEYEWRLKVEDGLTDEFDGRPRWSGELKPGGALLIRPEQCYGDMLQFCRYTPIVASLGIRVVLWVPPPLVRLLKSLDGVSAVVSEGDTVDAYDWNCPIGSLPWALRSRHPGIPAPKSYLRADPSRAEAWHSRLRGAGRGLRVGLAWAGRPSFARDSERSMEPQHLMGLRRAEGAVFFSLQKGGPKPPPESGLLDFTEELEDYADTAALLANLDLVISVDTSVAHLAGALGKPVWLLDRFKTTGDGSPAVATRPGIPA